MKETNNDIKENLKIGDIPSLKCIKVASVVWGEKEQQKTAESQSILARIKYILQLCEKKGVMVVVFPPFIGSLFESNEQYLEEILRLSLSYSVYICPGSFFEKTEEQTFHTSCVVKDGEILLWQRQLYRAKWEKRLGLSQGTDLSHICIGGIQVSIILSTDIFYPQVSRYAALAGADLVLSPTAIIGKRQSNLSGAIDGLWQNVQSNLFFAIESGYKGNFRGNFFSGDSVIHAPLVITDREDGFLAHEQCLPQPEQEGCLIVAELNMEQRKKVLEHSYNPLTQLNYEAYPHLFQKGSIEYE